MPWLMCLRGEKHTDFVMNRDGFPGRCPGLHTLTGLAEMLVVAGLSHPSQLDARHLVRRLSAARSSSTRSCTYSSNLVRC